MLGAGHFGKVGCSAHLHCVSCHLAFLMQFVVAKTPWLSLSLRSGRGAQVYRGLWRGHHDVAIKQLTCYADEMLLSALVRPLSFNRR